MECWLPDLFFLYESSIQQVMGLWRHLPEHERMVVMHFVQAEVCKYNPDLDLCALYIEWEDRAPVLGEARRLIE